MSDLMSVKEVAALAALVAAVKAAESVEAVAAAASGLGVESLRAAALGYVAKIFALAEMDASAVGL